MRTFESYSWCVAYCWVWRFQDLRTLIRVLRTRSAAWASLSFFVCALASSTSGVCVNVWLSRGIASRHSITAKTWFRAD
eukprot:1001505-Pleurochrysis_carterae.AAC.1